MVQKVEKFNCNALNNEIKCYLKILEEDCNKIQDLRFLVLRFCIFCEKGIDNMLASYIKLNDFEIEKIKRIQLKEYPYKTQKEKLKFSINNLYFNHKLLIMKSICKLKNENKIYFDFLDLLRDFRNVVAHQLITEDEFKSYLEDNKKTLISFIPNEHSKILNVFIKNKNFKEFLKFLLPSILIEFSYLQQRILNFNQPK